MLGCTDICNSVSPGDGYLESLIKLNTKAIFDGIKCVNESGILDNNKIQHDFDVIICATGFDVSHRPAFPLLGYGAKRCLEPRPYTLPQCCSTWFPELLESVENLHFIFRRGIS